MGNLFCVLVLTLASQGVVELTGSAEFYSLGEHALILEDEVGQLSFEQVTLLPDSAFTRSAEAVPNFGFTQSSYWVRLKLQADADNTGSWLFELGYPLLDDVQIFVQNRNGRYKHFELGDHEVFKKRPILHRHFLVPVQIQAGEKPEERATTLYVRVETSSSTQLPMTLWRPLDFVEDVNREMYGMGLYYGIMLVMIFYNGFLFLTVREPVYLHYVLYIASYTAFQMSLNGLAFEFLWGDFPAWANMCTPFFIACAGIFSGRFAQLYLQTETLSPRWHRFLGGYVVYSVGTAVLSLALPYEWSIKLAVVAAAVWAPTMFFLGLDLMREGHKSANYFFAAFAFFCVGMLVYVLKTLAILPSTVVTNYAIQFGSASEVILLSLGLGYRLSQLQREKRSLETDLAGALQTKLYIFSSVAHELNNPLNFAKMGVEEISSARALHDSVIADLFTGTEDDPDAIRLKSELDVASDRAKSAEDSLRRGIGRAAVVVEQMRGLAEIDGTIVRRAGLLTLVKSALDGLRAALGEDVLDNIELDIPGEGESWPDLTVNPYMASHAIRCVQLSALDLVRGQDRPCIRHRFEQRGYRSVLCIGSNAPAMDVDQGLELFMAGGKGEEGTGLGAARSILRAQGGDLLLVDLGQESGWVSFELIFGDPIQENQRRSG